MKEIKLSQGLNAIVDDEDYEELNLYKWCAIKNYNVFYAMRRNYVDKKNNYDAQVNNEYTKRFTSRPYRP